MNKSWAVLISACATVLIVGVVVAINRTEQAEKVDVNLDEKSAVQIAEIVLVRVYGDQVLAQKPWNVSRQGAAFKIEGMLPEKEGYHVKGGVAEITISQISGEVLAITHGK